MGDDLEYHNQLARSGASQFTELGDELTTLAKNLDSQVGADSPWANDKIGSAFAGQFDAHRKTAIANVAAFAKKVASYGPAITGAADGVVNTDTPH